MNKLIIFPLLALIASFSADAAVFRWVDSNGKVHYGDKIPPKAAQNGHTKLNKNGTEKEKVVSADVRKSQMLEIKAEKARQEELKKIRQAKANRKMRDKQLLSIYSNVDELKKVYSNKLDIADDTLKTLKQRHKKLSDRLEEYEARYEKIVNDKDKRKAGARIDDMLDNLNIYQQAITENKIERRKLEKRFDRDLTRFVELTSAD